MQIIQATYRLPLFPSAIKILMVGLESLKYIQNLPLLPTQKHKLFRRQPKISADINLEDASIESIMKGDELVTVADMDKATNTIHVDPALLEKIDKLFELNIGEDVVLPQVRLW